MENLANKRILITGASAGIGKALALELADNGAELFLLARRGDRLMQVEGEIRQRNKNCKVNLIVADVNDPELPQILERRIDQDIDVLVNNAGLALGREKMEEAKWEDCEEMIQTNITANFKLVHTVLPWMVKAGSGDIINLCSIAGHLTYIGGAVYAATKHAVSAFTKTVREETAGRNIRVMQISPGMVETEFSVVRFKGDEEKAKNVYAGMDPLKPEDISRMMVFMLEQPRHVVIDEIITMPQAQGSASTVVRSKN
jgi:NADP-dependent 3-hydroxy acid dehydrogenase YdfG